MRITIIGQQDFGKAVLEAFLARGDEVAGEEEGGSLASDEALQALREKLTGGA